MGGQRSVAQTRPHPAPVLSWYDRHRRDLPWRAPPGEQIDPFRVWLSEIMLQQTTVKTVAPYYARFLSRWPNLAALAAAPLEEVLQVWAGLGYYARARNLHACARTLVTRYNGKFPSDRQALRALPGIGPYTANAIAAIAFDEPVVAVDGNVERIIARLFAVADAWPAAKSRIDAQAQALAPDERAGDFAQALMDLGATICTPQRPACALCPWQACCAAHQRGDPETFPRKPRKREGLLRRGAAFFVRRADGAVLVRTRALDGLLGGMTELPTTAWTPDFDPARAIDQAPRLFSVGNEATAWRQLPGRVTHVFTHFPLELVVYAASVVARTPAPPGMR
ncbi:MAG TPA: A/G-specific adenine glycosylase, partial [Xanthobacteraceae bacterium]|nr:A/G-specific adenine glycosylase [Xanthobacteraceae bacterium]